MPPPPPLFTSPTLNVVPNAVSVTPVHSDTVEFAKKLIDELSSSQKPTKAARMMPIVPSFPPDYQPRKLTPLELLGETDTDAVSETDWEKKQCDSSEGGNSSDAREAEEQYSDGATVSEEGESSCSDFESGSSFERKKMKKKFQNSSNRKTASSATSKQAASARKESHKKMNARAFLASPQSVYLKEKAKSKKPDTKKSAPKNKKAAATSSDSEESSSETQSSTESEDAAPKKKRAPSGAKKPPPKKAVQQEADPGKKPQKGSKHAVMRVEGEFDGDMRAGIPIVDSRPGKKRTRAGRKRNEKREGLGRKKARGVTKQKEDLFEVLPPREAQLRPTQEQLNAVRITKEDGILDEDDPMLPEEVLVPLIQNELADNGIILANELDQPMKVWDAEVSCKGGYHWVMGDVNSHTFPDPPFPPTFVPNGTPGPNSPGLQHMHAVEVLERFLPLKFWAGFTQETNAYHDRCQKDPSNADPDEKDVETALNGQPYAKAGWQHDYDLAWVPLSLGQSLKWFGIHVGMAIRPRHNTASHWDTQSYGCLTPENYSNYLSRNRFNLITKYVCT